MSPAVDQMNIAESPPNSNHPVSKVAVHAYPAMPSTAMAYVFQVSFKKNPFEI